MPSPYPNNKHKVLNGYPVNTPFKNINEVNDYFNNEKLICLLCGKEYKSLMVHLNHIHDMTADQYREKYAIPVRCGLNSPTTKDKKRKHVENMVNKGLFVLNEKGCDMSKYTSKPKRKCPQKSSIARNNLSDYMKPKRELVELNGKTVTFTEAREAKKLKKGTPEYRAMLLNRPQSQPDAVRKSMGSYWKGKKRPAETTKKRLETLKKNKENPND